MEEKQYLKCGVSVGYCEPGYGCVRGQSMSIQWQSGWEWDLVFPIVKLGLWGGLWSGMDQDAWLELEASAGV